MFALVLWKGTREMSVLPDGDVRGAEEKEGKWGNHFYPVKVVMRSTNEKWLESLHVSVEGDIIPDGDSLARSEDLLVKRVADRKAQNDKQKTQAASKKAYQGTMLKTLSIFEDESSADESSVGDKSKMSINDETEREADPANDVISSERDGSRSIDCPEKIPDARPNAEKSCHCSKFPEVTSTDIDLLVKILALARSIYKGEKSDETSTVGKTQPVRTGYSKNEEVPLFEGSSIRLPAWRIGVIVDTYKKNPRGMVRKLMTLAVGPETLKKSSPTGKGGWTPIPADVFEDVEMFVQKNVKKKYRLSHDEYKKCLTSQCATLRNPKSTSGSETAGGAKAVKGEKAGKKRDEKQPITTERKNDDQSNGRVEIKKTSSKQWKNVQKIQSKNRSDKKNAGDSQKERKSKQIGRCDEESETSGSDGTSDEEEMSEVEQPAKNKRSRERKYDNDSAKSGAKESKKNPKKHQEAQICREQKSRDNSVLENQTSRHLLDDDEARIVSGLNQGSIENIDPSNPSPYISHDTTLHNQSVKSQSNHQEAIERSTREESHVGEDSKSETASLKNPPQKKEDSKISSKIPCGEDENITKDAQKSFSGENQYHIQGTDKTESAYLKKIRELEAKLAEKSDEIDSKNTGKKELRSSNKPEVKKRKNANAAPQDSKKKSRPRLSQEQ